MPGGQLLVVAGGVDGAGRTGAEAIFRLATRALEVMVDEGRLRPEEARRISFPAYYRSREEYVEPLTRPPLGELLTLEDEVWTILPDSHLPAVENGGSSADYAAAWASWLQAFTEPVFFGSPLDADRNEGTRRALAERYYATVARLIEANPGAARTDWQVAAMRFSRTAATPD